MNPKLLSSKTSVDKSILVKRLEFGFQSLAVLGFGLVAGPNNWYYLLTITTITYGILAYQSIKNYKRLIQEQAFRNIHTNASIGQKRCTLFDYKELYKDPDDINPFEEQTKKQSFSIVKIDDIKNNWVLFHYDEPALKNQKKSEKLQDFLNMYQIILEDTRENKLNIV